MKITRREGDKITTYTMDLKPLKKLAKLVVGQVEGLLRVTFKKEEFLKKKEEQD